MTSPHPGKGSSAPGGEGEMPTKIPQDSKGSLELWGCSVSLCKAVFAKHNPGVIYSKIHINKRTLPFWENPLVVGAANTRGRIMDVTRSSRSLHHSSLGRTTAFQHKDKLHSQLWPSDNILRQRFGIWAVCLMGRSCRISTTFLGSQKAAEAQSPCQL